MAELIEGRLLELRASGTGRKVSGSIPYGAAGSVGEGAYREILEPLSLKPAADVLCLYAHDSAALLGRVSSGTLQLRNSNAALEFECDLPSTTLGNDVLQMVKRGDLRSASFGFLCKRQTWSTDSRERRILEADLREISLVAIGAYPGAGNLQLRHAEAPAPAHPRLVAKRRYLELLA